MSLRARNQMLWIAIPVLVGLSGCAMEQKKVEAQLKAPAVINCATAEGDIRMLKGEKAHVVEMIAEGVTAIVPAGLVVGLVSGTEGTKLKVATGDYNKQIDARIAAIQTQCGITD